MKYSYFIILLLLIKQYTFAQNYYCKFQNTNNKTNFEELDNDIAIKYLKLDIKTQSNSTYLSGSAFLKIKTIADSISLLKLMLINDYTVDSVLYGNQQLNFSHISGIINIDLPISFFVDDTFSVKIFYNGQTQGLWGINSAITPIGTHALWTLSESYHAHEWWPCRESLKHKLDSVDIWITVPKNETAGANGLLINVTNINSEYHRFEWKHRHKITYYLISIAVSDYLEYNTYAHLHSGDSILIQNFVYNDSSYFENNKSDIDKTNNLIEFYSTLYGDYPFANEKYGHCQAPFGGGMEHQTMCTIKDFGFRLNSHELAHQWFGDMVTCADWQDIWVNEGFAAYSEYLASVQYETPEEALAVIRFKQEDAMSQAGGSVYVPAIELANEYRIFSGRLTYSKGAAIIHQIRYILNNDSIFFLSLKNYLTQFKDSFATGNDFKTVLEETSGINFDSYFQQWYYGEGYPIYGIKWSSTNNSFFCKINQTTSTNTITFFDIPMEFRLIFNNGSDTIIRHTPTANTDSFMVELHDSVVDVVLDPFYFVMDRVEYISNISSIFRSYLSIYPNPCQDYFIVESDNQIQELKITDLSGKIIEKYTTKDRRMRINTSKLNKGLYLLIITQNNNKFFKKIIKL